MIYINQDQLKQLEALLNQSTMGIHILFDNPTLTEILSRPTESLDFFTLENMNKVQDILGEFLRKDNIEDKQRFIYDLDHVSYELLVRSYFNIVENAVLESTKLKH